MLGVIEFLLLLGFVGLAAACISSLRRVNRRMDQWEERLAQVERAAQLPDLSQRLQAELEPELEALRAQLREQDTTLRADLARLRKDLEAIPPPAPPPPPVAAIPLADRLQRRIEDELEGEGYRSVRVLGEAEELGEGRYRLRVEAVRSGLRIRGSVTTTESQLLAVELQPSYTLFP